MANTAQDAAKHLVAVQDELIKNFGGKPGYNPYLYASNVIAPALAKVSGPSPKQEDIDAAMKIKASEDNAKIKTAPTANYPAAQQASDTVVSGNGPAPAKKAN